MAMKIKATPILKGKDAENFLYKIKENETLKTSKNEIKNNINLFLNVMKKTDEL